MAVHTDLAPVHIDFAPVSSITLFGSRREGWQMTKYDELTALAKEKATAFAKLQDEATRLATRLVLESSRNC